MIGAPTLVPPKTYHLPPAVPPLIPAHHTPQTPVFGSATAATSPTVRLPQPLSVCHDGFAKTVLQPLPVPFHTVSLQPRELLAGVRLVPPTATTCGDDAGN